MRVGVFVCVCEVHNCVYIIVCIHVCVSKVCIPGCFKTVLDHYSKRESCMRSVIISVIQSQC